jgi:predicted transcriptional regulator
MRATDDDTPLKLAVIRALLDWRSLPESDLARMARPYSLVTDDLRAMSEEGLVEMEFSGDEFVVCLTRLGELFYEQAQS